jgi:hypothetical protein
MSKFKNLQAKAVLNLFIMIIIKKTQIQDTAEILSGVIIPDDKNFTIKLI